MKIIAVSISQKFRKALILSISVMIAISAFADTTVMFKVAPENSRIFDYGRTLVLQPSVNGARKALLPVGMHQFLIEADGYIPKTLFIPIDGKEITIEEKLERLESTLKYFDMVQTLPRPKSVECTPDGKFLVVAPLSDKSVEVIDLHSLKRKTLLEVPEQYAKYEGFVESAFLTDRDELWVSQMHTSKIHIFRLSDFSYLDSIPSGGNFPKVILPSSDGKRVFISNWISKSVSVIDPGTRKTVANVKLSGIPRGLALSEDGALLYAANFETGTIDVIDLTSYKIRKSLMGGGAKRHLVLDGRQHKLYISDMYSATISCMDLTTEKISGSVKVSDNPNTIKLSPDGKLLYVTTRGPNNPIDYERKGPRFGELLVINTSTMTITERHWGGNQPTGLCLSPDGKTVIFSDFLDQRLEIYKY